MFYMYSCLCVFQLLPFNINVGVVYPPDTETPGWVEENKDKVKSLQLKKS